MSQWNQSFTLTHNVCWGLSSARHLQYKGLLISPIEYRFLLRCVMSSKEACNNPGLCPVKRQKFGLCTWTRVQNQILSLPLGTDKTPKTNTEVAEELNIIPVLDKIVFLFYHFNIHVLQYFIFRLRWDIIMITLDFRQSPDNEDCCHEVPSLYYSY